jgi:hypothetical protein
MDRSKLLTFLVAFLALISYSFGQNSKPQNCETITFEAKVTAPNPGKNANTIQFVSDQDNKARFKIFLLNKGSDIARKEISDRRLTNLSPGVYEFIIIDVQNKGCFKEVIVRIPEQNN